MRLILLTNPEEFHLPSKQLPSGRLLEIEERANANEMTYEQALCYRAQLLIQQAIDFKIFTPGLHMRYGRRVQIAALFQRAVASYLRSNDIAFIADGCEHHKPEQVSHLAMMNPQRWHQMPSKNRFLGQCYICGTRVSTSALLPGRVGPRCKSCPRPDFILEDGVQIRINGYYLANIKWIECKPTYGAATIPFKRGKILRQVARYSAIWGRGAVVFRHGFCSDIGLPNEAVVMLDATPLDLTELLAFETAVESEENGM